MAPSLTNRGSVPDDDDVQTGDQVDFLTGAQSSMELGTGLVFIIVAAGAVATLFSCVQRLAFKHHSGHS